MGVTRSGEVDASQRAALDGFAIDCTEARVGSGRAAYDHAAAALLSWRHFDFDWAFTNAPPVAVDSPVVVVARSLLLWTLNPLRITGLDREGAPGSAAAPPVRRRARRRCAFVHTTVQGHQISGEEAFSVEWRKDDGSVWYRVLTVSRAATPVAALARPLLRFYQRRFVAQSIAKMAEIAGGGET